MMNNNNVKQNIQLWNNSTKWTVFDQKGEIDFGQTSFELNIKKCLAHLYNRCTLNAMVALEFLTVA